MGEIFQVTCVDWAARLPQSWFIAGFRVSFIQAITDPRVYSCTLQISSVHHQEFNVW